MSMMDKNERLQRALLDGGANELEAEEWAESLDTMLSKSPLPLLKPEKQTALLLLMKQELPAPKSLKERVLEAYPVALLLSQVRVIQREIWWASAFIMMIGVLVTLSPNGELLFSFATLAPIVAAASVGMLFDSDFRAMLDLEETSRASARLLLLARLTLVYGFNLLMALLCSVFLAIFDSETLLLPLISSWLAPMTFLSGLAFFLSITGRNSLFAGCFSLILWIGHMIFSQMTEKNWLVQLLSMPGLSEPSYRPAIILAGLLMVVASLWQLGIVERHPQQDILD
jgi:hypothetical protein